MTEPKDEKSYIYLVWWQYHDKSGHGHVRAFDDQGMADEFAAMLKEHGDQGKNYICDKIVMEVY